MPRVTAAYRDARRAEILSAARECFLERGFRATSMQELFASSGMSAGSVYSYFASKDELIVAIAEDNMREVLARFEALATRKAGGSVGDVLAEALELIRGQHERTGLAG